MDPNPTAGGAAGARPRGTRSPVPHGQAHHLPPERADGAGHVPALRLVGAGGLRHLHLKRQCLHGACGFGFHASSGSGRQAALGGSGGWKGGSDRCTTMPKDIHLRV